MKFLVLVLLAMAFSLNSSASDECKKSYRTIFPSEESRTLYASLSVKEEMIEHCGPYSGNCPKFLGKEIKTENIYVLCFKDSMCVVGVCPN